MLVCTLVLIYGIFFPKGTTADHITSKLEAKQIITAAKNNRTRRDYKDDNNNKFTDFLQQALKNLHEYNDSDLEYLFAVIGDEVRKSQTKCCKSPDLIDNNSFRRFLVRAFETLKYQPATTIRHFLKAIANKIELKRYNNNEKELVNFINSLYMQDSIAKFKTILFNIDNYRRNDRKTMDIGKILREGVRSAMILLRTEAQDSWNYFLQLAFSQVMKHYLHSYTSNPNIQRMDTTEKPRKTSKGAVEVILDMKYEQSSTIKKEPKDIRHATSKHANRPTRKDAERLSTNALFESDEDSSMGESETVELGNKPSAERVSKHKANVATMKPHKPKRITEDYNKSEYEVDSRTPVPNIYAKQFNSDDTSFENKARSSEDSTTDSVTDEDLSIEELSDAPPRNSYRKMDKSNSVDIVTENNVIKRIADLEYDVKVIKTQIKNGSEIVGLLNNKVYTNEVKLEKLYHNQTYYNSRTDDSNRRIFNISVEKQNGKTKTNTKKDGSSLDRRTIERQEKKQHEYDSGSHITRSKEEVLVINNSNLNKTLIDSAKLLKLTEGAENARELKDDTKIKTSKLSQFSKYKYIQAVDEGDKKSNHSDEHQHNQEKAEVDTIILNSKVKDSKLKSTTVNFSNTIPSEAKKYMK